MININMDGVLTLPSLPSQHKEFLPEVSGLYFVIAYTPEPQLVYLGKAKNFFQRWQKHHRQPEVNLLQKLGLDVDIHWLELRVTDEILSQWENQLIKDLSPALNDTLTMATEVNRLENKVAQLEEFVIEPARELALLPNLALLPSPLECTDAPQAEIMAVQCPKCGSADTRTNGKRGNKIRYRCKSCGASWSE